MQAVKDDAEQEITNSIDGIPVVARGVAIKNAGDGLSEALALGIESGELHVGQRVTILLEGVIGPVKFEPTAEAKKSGALDEYKRIDSVVAEYALVVSQANVSKIMTGHRKQVDEARSLAKEAAEGIKRIPFGDTDDDEAAAAEDGVSPDKLRSIGDGEDA